MRENPKGWRSRFLTMAENAFAFSRVSAVLFYRDMQQDSHHDSWYEQIPILDMHQSQSTHHHAH
jgi:uncharacterized protein (DUF2252 family)